MAKLNCFAARNATGGSSHPKKGKLHHDHREIKSDVINFHIALSDRQPAYMFLRETTV